MKILTFYNQIAQIVKPYDPDTMPAVPAPSSKADSLMPILIAVGLGIMIFIVITVFLIKKRR
ncbi:hypothetical protein KDA11_00200 [Candidatus Saccharibacteria bacterium]|nr:hypothetical protein [Candidatus Saccharibacteria bacterium]